MEEGERLVFDRRIRSLCENGDFDGAATEAIRGYGPEIFGFLVAVHRDETAASDSFSSFAEGLWRGLPTFGWSSTLRTWAYAIARNVSRQARRAQQRQNRRGVRVGESALEDVAEQVRTSTLGYLRTEKRGRLEALRDALSADDRALLVLRLDRGLAWPELARVMTESDEPLDDAAVTKEAARLRKRFQLVKERLRELVKGDGTT